MTTLVSTQKSTIVRSVLEALLRQGSGLAPGLFARGAVGAFLWTPRRRLPSPSQLRTMAAARSLELGFSGRTLRTYAWGDGPTVLLVHGWGGIAAQLHAFVGPLVAAGFRVVAFDLPGHGRSSGNMTDLVEVGGIVRRVAEWFGPVHAVVAHSLGAAATGIAVADGLDVDRLVMIGAAVEPHRYWRHFQGMLSLSPAARERADKLLQARVGRSIEEISMIRNLRRARPELMVVHDEKDRWADVEAARRLAAAKDDAQLLTTFGLGHARILEDAHVVEEVASFLRPPERLTAASKSLCASEHCTSLADPSCDADDPRCLECLISRELETPALRWNRTGQSFSG